MKALSTGIFTKFTGSALSTALGGRMYKQRAPENTTYPYCVYYIIVSTPDNTFTENLEDVLVQFSLFSSASSSDEIGTLLDTLTALYDDCTLTITGATPVYMQRANITPTVEDHVTTSGTVEVWATHIDYDVKYVSYVAP